MTMINVGGEASAAEMSANAKAMGLDNSLTFEFKSNSQAGSIAAVGFNSSGLLTINRAFRFKRDDVTLGGRVGTTHLNITAGQPIDGRVFVRRGTDVTGEIPFSIPPAGQIQPPSNVSSLQTNPQSTLRTSKIAGWEITAALKDPSGKTTRGGAKNVWLGQGATIMSSPEYEVRFDPTGNDLTQTSGPTMTIVPYDKLADKEGEPITINPAWTFSGFRANPTNSISSAQDMSGNIPQGTVINYRQGLRLIDDSSVILANSVIANYTVSAAGGVLLYPGGNTVERIYSGNSYILGVPVILYKLSTHSQWKVASGSSSEQIANIFSEGSNGGAINSYSAPGATQVAMVFGFPQLPMAGPNFSSRFELKIFCAGKQVAGTGAVKNSGASTFPIVHEPVYDLTNTTIAAVSGLATYGGNANNLSFKKNYNNEHDGYAEGAPRGDQYYTNNVPIGIKVSVPPHIKATGLEIYARPVTYSASGAPGSLSGGVPYQLIYDGPATSEFLWGGAVVNANYPPASTNTTATYPATYAGVTSWSATAEEIVVQPGDQVFCELTSATLSYIARVQVTVPVEFLD